MADADYAHGEPVWVPDDAAVAHANITAVADHLELEGVGELHRWSVARRADFWGLVIDRLGIVFRSRPDEVLGRAGSPEFPQWLPGARLNIVESCFRHDPERAALVARRHGEMERFTYGELQRLVARFANGLAGIGVAPGDPVAIAMPMNVEAVVAYLGTVAAGAVVVSIADSFAPDEIATRLRITGADLVVTQDRMVRGGRELPMYRKVVAAGASRAIVVDTGGDVPLDDGSIRWDEFLAADDEFECHIAEPDATTNVLFSSGTTGEPKAIPWSQLTPLKAAMDAHFHQDVHPDDTLAWPTNLGWMMGPWLIYAAMLNGAAFAVHDDQPTDAAFGRFVAGAGVTMLGVVPSLVATWRATGCLDGLDWSRVTRFSSTGEASSPEDMTWLMTFSGPKPVLEYIGGTEVGGGYLCGSMVQPAVPSMFSTPALGLDLRILDEGGAPTTSGELFLVPPSIGLSRELLNRDHHDVYYAGTPRTTETLRRHGDHIERVADGYYRAQGRIDDTMNLGGIKVSSAELERSIRDVPGLAEAAAVAAPPPGGGPERLVVFAVAAPGIEPNLDAWRQEMQAAIRQTLNPLFKIHEVVAVGALPRTASHKVMRRLLRARYTGAEGSPIG
ncbi:MAG: AMP-binding protein [Acidimicrobiia bacterium]